MSRQYYINEHRMFVVDLMMLVQQRTIGSHRPNVHQQAKQHVKPSDKHALPVTNRRDTQYTFTKPILLET